MAATSITGIRWWPLLTDRRLALARLLDRSGHAARLGGLRYELGDSLDVLRL